MRESPPTAAYTIRGNIFFFEGDKENNTDTYPLYRIDAADGKNLKKELALDNIYCELYFFEGHLYQYDTVKGNLIGSIACLPV